MAHFRPNTLLAEIAEDPKVIFVTGKGGVGKSTVAALLVESAIRSGLRCAEIVLGDFAKLEIQDEESGDLASDVTTIGNESAASTGTSETTTDTINIDPAEALIEYLEDHGFGKFASRLIGTGVIGVVSTAIPGIRDLLLLGKIKQIERDSDYDLLVVDSPATGHALSFLTSPTGLKEIADIGPLRSQAEDVIAMLQDHQRVGCVVVTIPEETPVAESIELIKLLETKVGVKVTSIVVNQVLDPVLEVDPAILQANPKHPLVTAYRYSKGWETIQRVHIDELLKLQSPKVVELPLVFDVESPKETASAVLEKLDNVHRGHVIEKESM